MEKAMEKRKQQKMKEEQKLQHEASKSDFQRALEERAKKLDDVNRILS